MPEILKTGVLRAIVLKPSYSDTGAINKEPAKKILSDEVLARQLSEHLGLELELVVIEDYNEAYGKLISDEGDIIVHAINRGDKKKEIGYSIPFLHSEALFIKKKGETSISDINELRGNTICANSKKLYYDIAKDLKVKLPNIKIKNVSASLKTSDIIDLILRDKCYGAIIDSNYWGIIKNNYPEIDTPLSLTEPMPVAVAFMKGSKVLRKEINEFLISNALNRKSIHTDDFDEIKRDHKTLRVITSNSALSYYIYKGVEMGFEYDLLKRFADLNKIGIKVIVPPADTNPFDLLNLGIGDVIADSITISDSNITKASFTRPYNSVDQVLAVHKDYDKINEFKDLFDKTIYFLDNTAYSETLKEIQPKIGNLKLIPLTDEMEMEEVLSTLDSGKFNITITDSNHLRVEQSYGRNIKATLTLKNSDTRWAVRKSNDELLKALNNYIDTEYKKLHFNLIKNKYFKDLKIIRQARDANDYRSDKSGKISPFDKIVKTYSEKYNFDWRLINALIFEESSFIEDKMSWAGAKGLMQVMDGAAKDMNIKGDVFDPKVSIHIGTKYLKHLLDRYESEIVLRERIRFALASYNVGYHHVQDARLLAAKLNLDPDIWYDNVEKTILLLSKRKYYKNAKYGYCRGREPVNYVRDIENRYNSYVAISQINK